MKPNAAELLARLERFQSFLAQDPTNINLAQDVAQLQYQLGEFPAARKTIENGLIHAPHHPGLTSLQASIAMAEGRAEEAVILLEGLRDTGVDAPALLYNLAYAYSYCQRFSDARTALEPLRNDPQIPAAKLLMARAFHHLGQLEDAIALVKEFIEIQPNHADAHGLLAMLQLDAQHTEEARHAAVMALSLDPNDVSAHITLGSIAVGEQDDLNAHEHYTHAIRLQAKNGRAWSGLGLTSMMRSDLNGAIDQLRKAVHFMPEHIGTWHALAWCQLMTDDISGAQYSFERSLALNRNFSETHGGLAVVALIQGRIADAEYTTKLALRLDPTSFAGRYAQSLLMQESDPRAAQDIIQQILSESVSPTGESLGELARRALQRRKKDIHPNRTLH